MSFKGSFKESFGCRLNCGALAGSERQFNKLCSHLSLNPQNRVRKVLPIQSKGGQLNDLTACHRTLVSADANASPVSARYGIWPRVAVLD